MSAMQDRLDYRAIGRRVRELRTSSGLTQEELAEKIDVSASFVGHIERGGCKKTHNYAGNGSLSHAPRDRFLWKRAFWSRIRP